MRAAHLMCSLAITVNVLGYPSVVSAQRGETDSSAIQRLIQSHAEAWNRHDAVAAAAVYAPNADIRYSSGERLQGRPAIEAAHRAAFAGEPAGKGSRHSHPLASLWLRFVRPDLALAEVESRYDFPADSAGESRRPDRSLLFLVLTKEQGHWQVLAQRNLGPVH
jgi:uncharacterized protein (TIGR02246 family)